MTRTNRHWFVLVAIAGAVCAWVWVAAWGFAVANVWSPLFHKHWQVLGGGNPSVARVYSGVFDFLVIAVLALLTCVPLSYIWRGRRPIAWLVFVAALLACLMVPAVLGGEVTEYLAFLFSHALVWAILAASAVAFWVGGVLRGKHVQA
jgi:hypothetical protein